MTVLSFACLVLSCVLLSVAQETSVTCMEPMSIAELYRTLRSRTIETAAQSQEGESTADNHQFHHVTTTALNYTCHHHHQTRVCTCPAIHELNFDPTRIPKAFIQTRCCRENQKNVSDWITKCSEVYENVKVLRRTGCSEGVFRYRLQWERMPVGCSCHVISRLVSSH